MQELHLPPRAVSSVLPFRVPRFLVCSKSEIRPSDNGKRRVRIWIEVRHARAARPPRKYISLTEFRLPFFFFVGYCSPAGGDSKRVVVVMS